MATPLGHYLFGLAIAEALGQDRDEREWAPWLAAIACVPDLDFLPGLLMGDPSRFHHGASHSLTAAVLFTIVAVPLLSWRGRRPWGRLLVLVFALYASHVVLDFVTLDPGEPRGVPLWWPWLPTTYESPWLLLPNVQHTREPLLSAHNALLMVQEAVLFLPLVGLVRALKGPGRPWAEPVTWLCGAWFVAAVGISVASLNSF